MARETVDPAQREIGERAAVEIDHRELIVTIELCGRPEQAVARIVNEISGLEIANRELLRDELGAVAAVKVDGEDVRGAMSRGADARGDFGELRRPAGCQH